MFPVYQHADPDPDAQLKAVAYACKIERNGRAESLDIFDVSDLLNRTLKKNLVPPRK